MSFERFFAPQKPLPFRPDQRETHLKLVHLHGLLLEGSTQAGLSTKSINQLLHWKKKFGKTVLRDLVNEVAIPNGKDEAFQQMRDVIEDEENGWYTHALLRTVMVSEQFHHQYPENEQKAQSGVNLIKLTEKIPATEPPKSAKPKSDQPGRVA